MGQPRVRVDDRRSAPLEPAIGSADSRRATVGLAALAHLGWSYLRWVGKRRATVWVDHRGDLLAPAEVMRIVEPAARGGRPLLVVYWISDTLALATVPFTSKVAQTILETVTVLVDATLAGRVTGLFLDRIGAQHRVLQRSDHPERLRQLMDIMRRRESCAIAVDGGGPYRTVGTGLLSLALTLDAIIVPVAARASMTTTFAPRSRVKVPLPGCHVVVAVGERHSVARTEPRREAADRLRSTLDELGHTADRIVRQGAAR